MKSLAEFECISLSIAVNICYSFILTYRHVHELEYVPGPTQIVPHFRGEKLVHTESYYLHHSGRSSYKCSGRDEAVLEPDWLTAESLESIQDDVKVGHEHSNQICTQ